MKGETMNENGFVNISVEEYNKLVNNATKYRVLFDGIIKSTDLDYTGKELIFDTLFIRTLVKALDGHLYNGRLYELKIEQQRKEAENADV